MRKFKIIWKIEFIRSNFAATNQNKILLFIFQH